MARPIVSYTGHPISITCYSRTFRQSRHIFRLPLLPAAPVDVAEFLTALVERGAGLSTVLQARGVRHRGLSRSGAGR